MSFDALEAQGSLLEKLTASLDTKIGYIDENSGNLNWVKVKPEVL